MKRFTRRKLLGRMLAGAGALSALETRLPGADANLAATDPKDHIKITKLETFPVNKTRSVFLKVHTDAGIVGLGEPSLEGWSPTVQLAVKEIEPYLVGKDPRQPVHHWQAIYRHAFYRGGPLLTSALSGIDMALRSGLELPGGVRSGRRIGNGLVKEIRRNEDLPSFGMRNGQEPTPGSSTVTAMTIGAVWSVPLTNSISWIWSRRFG